MNLFGYSTGKLAWRSTIASPFVLSILLAVAVGPATINHRYGSFGWLIAISLIAAGLMLTLPDALLIPTGLIVVLFFPPMAALAFYFAPAWAVPIAAVVFYGSMIASLAASAGAVVALLRRRFRKRSKLSWPQLRSSGSSVWSPRAAPRASRQAQLEVARRAWVRSSTVPTATPSLHSRRTVEPCSSTATTTRSASVT